MAVKVIFDQRPLELSHAGKSIKITQVGLHHKYYEGRTLHHVFSVCSDSAYFRLNLDTETLLWTLEDYELQQ